MTFYVTDQNFVVLSLIILGAVFGFLWDVFGVVLHKAGAGYVIKSIAELVLCLVFGFVYQVTVFVTNYGYVRWYEIVGTVSGFLIYRLTLSKTIRKILAAIISIVAGIVGKVLSALMYPLRRIAKKLWQVLRSSFSAVAERLSDKGMQIYSAIAVKKQLKFSKKGFTKKIYRTERKEI